MNTLRLKTLQAMLWSTTFALLTPPALYAQDHDNFGDALTQGDISLSFNYRFEYVDQDGFSDDAKASTLRSRLTYQSGGWRGFSALLEFDDISEIGPDDYNAGGGNTPDRTNFPVVADPADTHINQVYLDYRPTENIGLRGGRQRIKLDNDRFIGNVGWRQNEQTYDAIRMDWSFGDVTFLYSYVFNVNRIFGNDVAAGDHDHDTHLAHIDWALNPKHKFSAYFYAIDNQDADALSNNSAGLRYTGQFELGNQRPLNLLAEYAHQSDAGDNPVDYSADYWHGRLGLGLHSLATITTGIEILSGDRRGGRAFRTPLATLHAFNGWADLFLATPNTGLEDIYAGINGKYQRVSWQLYWHHFQAETGGSNFGTEWDAALKISVYDDVSLLLKAAHFDSDNSSFPDTTKFWTMLSAKF